MAKFDVKGLKELQKAVQNAPDNIMKDFKKATKECAELALESEKKSAPKDTGRGSEGLAIVECREGKSFIYYDIGINSKNWEQVKHLYFQNYGYYNNWTGERYEGHVGWMKKAINSCSGTIKARLNKVAYDSLNRVFK